MDKTESYLTQAIVGKRQRLVLGNQVRDQGERLLPVHHPHGILATLKRLGELRTSDRALRWFERGAMATVVLGVILGGAAGYVRFVAPAAPMVSVAPQPEPSLPLVPAASSVSVSAISVDPLPFPDEETGGSGLGSPESAGTLAAIGPITEDPPEARSPLPSHPLPPAQVAQDVPRVEPKRAEAALQKEPRGAKEKPKEDAPKGLVLDVAKDAADRPAASRQQPPAAATPGLATNGIQKGLKLAEPIEVGGGGVGKQGVSARPTIVTIADDGSFVLITNPTTRLPQKYQVGQKLPSGGTVEKIDHTKGQVQIDGQMFSLQ